MEGVLIYIGFAFYIVSFLSYLVQVSSQKKPKRINTIGFNLLVVAFISLTLALILRWNAVSHPPFQTLYESLLTLIWLMTLTLLFFEIRTKITLATPLYLIIILIALSYTIFKTSARQVPSFPALQSYWFYIHVPITLLSYAVFILAFSYDISFRIWRKREIVPSQRHYARKIILAGFPLLTAGIFFGAAWANDAWGTYWGWDPKEMWSLITWFAYVIYLHLAFSRNWEKRFAFVMNIIGFIFVVTTYIGVNYIARIFSVESLHLF